MNRYFQNKSVDRVEVFDPLSVSAILNDTLQPLFNHVLKIVTAHVHTVHHFYFVVLSTATRSSKLSKMQKEVLLHSVMAKAHFAQKHGEASGFAVFERSQNVVVKEAH